MESQSDKSLNDLIWQDADRMSGALCIFGTRIRVQDLFDWMASGGSVDTFVETYPHVPRDTAVGILRLAESDLLKHFEAA